MHERVVFGAESVAGIVRVTTSFDFRYTGPVLRRVARLFSDGFESSQAEALLKELEGIRAESPMAWNYRVVYKRKVYQLQIKALVDDLGMIDLDFATDPELAAQIRGAVDGYLNRRN
jgi:hypothetical protein